jgi:glyoxylase-like metal-dependent hydrolase (beta-lactamase superfamily II)
MQLGPVRANCYTVEYAENKAFIVDIGGEPELLEEFLAEKNLTATAILLTHGHFDHILGVAAIAKRFACPVYIHPLDADKLTSPLKSLQVFHPESLFYEVENFTPATDEIVIGNPIGTAISPTDSAANMDENQGSNPTNIKTIHTPGHTAGSVCFLFEDFVANADGNTVSAANSDGNTNLDVNSNENTNSDANSDSNTYNSQTQTESTPILFTGDTLFSGGDIGRTDFPDGNERDMMESLRRLFTLDKNTKIYPGHGNFGHKLDDCVPYLFPI